MRRETRYDYAAAVAVRYRRASKAAKGRILDEFCAATGYSRKHAIHVLGGPFPRPLPARHGRPRVYGPAAADVLYLCWEVADRICGKRLAPFLPELLGRLAACAALPDGVTPAVLDQVARLSPATADRLLAPRRARPPGRGRAVTKPGTLLRQQIPIKTFADWDDAVPGFLEMDLVAHCGSTGGGTFLLTLSTVDVATGWAVCMGVRNKAESSVFEALTRIRERLPFPLRGLDCDNGSEFLNQALVRYCAAEGITLTRSRPYRKNDNCHIEQKNWSVVRRLAGYARFELAALPALNRLYALAEDYVNFLQPVLKLAEKTRDGPRVRRRYDTARTPYRRLVASGALDATADAALAHRSQALHPIRLKLAMEEAQQALYARAVECAPAPRQRWSLGTVWL